MLHFFELRKFAKSDPADLTRKEARVLGSEVEPVELWSVGVLALREDPPNLPMAAFVGGMSLGKMNQSNMAADKLEVLALAVGNVIPDAKGNIASVMSRGSTS